MSVTSRLWHALVASVTTALLVLALTAAAEPDDPYFQSKGSWQQPYDDQWALHAIGFTALDDKNSAWNITTGRKNQVIVAVLDTGLDFFHPDLNRDNIWRNHAEQANGIDDDGNGYVDDLIGWDFVEGDNNPWDFAGHGTHVAGLIGAAANNGEGIAGINWGVQIMPLKVMNFGGRGATVGLAEAIYYAVAQGARVINLSFGGEEQSQIQREAIAYAHDHGVLVVVAAGNSAIDVAGVSPAGLDTVLTVASTTPDGKHAGFSNWGDAIDISAPGVDILSLRARRTDFALVAGQIGYSAGDGNVGPDSKYYRATGTSFSAPLVSGVASLLFAQDPSRSAADVRRMMLQTAHDIDVPGIDRYTGYGVLDARAALQASPEFYVDAAIYSVEVAQQGKKTVLRVLGTGAANELKGAWIEIGAGEEPAKWSRVADFRKAVRDGPLASIDVQQFRAAKTWTLRLIVEHRNGRKREARFVLNLG